MSLLDDLWEKLKAKATELQLKQVLSVRLENIPVTSTDAQMGTIFLPSKLMKRCGLDVGEQVYVYSARLKSHWTAHVYDAHGEMCSVSEMHGIIRGDRLVVAAYVGSLVSFEPKVIKFD